jgi:hypothetical protein
VSNRYEHESVRIKVNVTVDAVVYEKTTPYRGCLFSTDQLVFIPLWGLCGNSISNRLYAPIFRYLKLAIPFYLLPDDSQTVLPELARADVDAEAGGVGLQMGALRKPAPNDIICALSFSTYLSFFYSWMLDL